MPRLAVNHLPGDIVFAYKTSDPRSLRGLIIESVYYNKHKTDYYLHTLGENKPWGYMYEGNGEWELFSSLSAAEDSASALLCQQLQTAVNKIKDVINDTGRTSQTE